MLNLSELKSGKNFRPPLITIYGRPKVGKTTFAANAPSTIVLAIEKGQDAVDCTTAPINNYDDMIEVIKALHEQDHNFKTVAVDSADWLEAIIHQQVAKDNGVKSIEDIGYGKGYIFALNLWRSVLSGLESLRDNKNMTIIMIAHDHVKRYDNPLTDSYDRYELKLHAKAAALLSEWSDCILFATHKVHTKKEEAGFNKKIAKAKGGGRVLYTSETPAFTAGNRYGLPEELPLDWDEFNKALKESMK